MPFQSNYSPAATGAVGIDQGLRAYMLGVYRYMAGGLGLTGLVALFTLSSPVLLQAIFGSGLHWLLFIAQIGLVLWLSLRIERLSLGAVRAIPSYNVMGLAKASLEANVRFLAADLGPQGIRVNGISAGPIKTLASAGVAGLRKMLARVAQISPIRRNVTQEDVGNTAAFLCSDLSAGITGEIIYVDGGFSTIGMSFPPESEG
jgi:NAD(P)-dependent dehydrogenase (short-subunit alcohol dehydrogenase family)